MTPKSETLTFLVNLVCASRYVSPHLMFVPNRCDASVAYARQICMYLMHTALGLSFTETGTHFNRDRTSVSHAVTKIEVSREDERFDIELESMGHALKVFEESQ